ncbi:ketopantoate reductase family protein [Candidatus Latescibacterota bacterium]
MRIAVMGAGGQGGLLGGLLAGAGEDVTLIARGKHLQAIRERGLTVRSQTGGEKVVSPGATDDPRAVGPVDLVLFCVKVYDLPEAAAQCLPLVGKGTTVLTVQNGIEAPDQLREVLGPDPVIGGVSYLQATVESPGVISHGGFSNRLLLGELEGGTSPRAARVRELFGPTEVEAEEHPDIRLAMWEKLVLLCGTGGVLALVRLPLGPVLACEESRDLLRGAMLEAEAVARASGVALAEGTADRHFEALQHDVSPSLRSSQLTDVERGLPLELESLTGTVVRLGRELGVLTPMNAAVYAGLKPHVRGAPSPRP